MFKKTHIVTLMLLLFLFVSCESPDPVEKEKKRILTEDESSLIHYYMKITKFEKNLHDKESGKSEKSAGLKNEIDSFKVKKIIDEENTNPERWIGVLNRLHKLQRIEEK